MDTKGMICINSNSNNLIDFDVVKPDLFPWSMEDGAFMSTKNMNEEDNSSSSTAYYCRESHNAGKRAAPCQYLPPQFQPNNFTVMIGRCKEARSNIGNRRLRVLASTYLRQYAKADSKRVKSNIVKEIRDAILEAEGQFIQMDEDKRWYIVNDTVAREKIGYVLRDLLADQYKSSSKQKSAVAKERRHREHLQQDSFTAPMVPTCSTNLSMKNSNYYMVPPSVETTNGGGGERVLSLDIIRSLPPSRSTSMAQQERQGPPARRTKDPHSAPSEASVPPSRHDFPW